MKKRMLSILLAAMVLLGASALADTSANGLATGTLMSTVTVYDGVWDNANAVGTLDIGTGVIILQTYGNWVQIHARAQRIVGWVQASAIRLDSAATPVYTGVVISQNVSLRTDRSTGSTRLASIPNSTILEILDEQDGWYYITYWNSKDGMPLQGWALSDYIVRDPSYVTTTGLTYVYATPSRSAKKVGQLVSGTQLVVIGEYGDFWVVNLRSASGFIYKRDIESNPIWGGNG